MNCFGCHRGIITFSYPHNIVKLGILNSVEEEIGTGELSCSRRPMLSFFYLWTTSCVHGRLVSVKPEI